MMVQTVVLLTAAAVSATRGNDPTVAPSKSVHMNCTDKPPTQNNTNALMYTIYSKPTLEIIVPL